MREREEQKQRAAHADEDYYKAMRRFALEAGDPESLRFYDEKLKDLELLQYELEALSEDNGDRP